MKTPVNSLKVVLCCLGLLFLVGSSNHVFTVAFYHSKLQSRTIAINYFQFPKQFIARRNELNDDSLFELVKLGIDDGLFSWSLRLLENNKPKRAKRYWQKTLRTQKTPQLLQLAEQLLRLKQWPDLTSLAKKSFIPPSSTLEIVKLHIGLLPQQISPEFAARQSFLLHPKKAQTSTQCRFNVLLMSDHYQGLKKLATYKARYQQQPEPSSGSFCFSRPVYLGKQISCNSSPLQRAYCQWQAFIKTTTLAEGFDFIVMMPRLGHASVQSGVMHLNSSSHYGIFLHELMHFNGFEDEYPLPAAKQQWLCKLEGKVAPNLFISQKQQAPKGWSVSQACQQGGIAYKPTKALSIMQYQQVPLSARYRRLWQRQIDDLSVEPLSYRNLFISLAESDNSMNNMTNKFISE